MGIGATLEIAREGGGGEGQLDENKGGYRGWGRSACHFLRLAGALVPSRHRCKCVDKKLETWMKTNYTREQCTKKRFFYWGLRESTASGGGHRRVHEHGDELR